MQLPRRTLRRLGIVGDHDDGFVLFTIHDLQQIEDLLRHFAIKIARGLIADQQCWICHQRPCNGDALLLPT